jgi:hypothetical protein
MSSVIKWIAVISLVVDSLVPLAGVSAASTAQTVGSLALDPSSGSPPSVSGSLSGEGWCTPAQSVQVSGSGVSGSGAVGRTGHLSGSFTVSGSAGDIVTISVFVSCGDTSSTGRANFTFNSPRPTAPPTRPAQPTATPIPPTAAPTSTPLPTATPTDTPTATATDTPVPSPTPELVTSDAPGTLRINGCSPAPSQITLVFQPLALANPGEDGFGEPDGSGVPVQVRASDDPGLFLFDLPPGELGRHYQVETRVESPDCAAYVQPPTKSWTPGSSLAVSSFLPGSTELWMSSKGGVPPGLSGEFTGTWVKQYGFYDPDKYAGRNQAFRWSTDLSNADGGKLQASIFPFNSASNGAGDVFDPPGLVAEWQIDCVNCEFTIDLSALSPKQAAAPQTVTSFTPAGLVKQLGAWFKQLLDTALEAATGWIQTLSPHPDVPGGGTPLAPSIPSDSLVLVPMAPESNPLLPTEFYLRIVPVHNGAVAGALSDTDRMTWLGDSLVEPGGLKPSCTDHPELPDCLGSEFFGLYTVEVIAYHGWIAPAADHVGCYLATKTTTIGKPPGPTLTFPEGYRFCPDKTPQSKGLIEAIVDAVANVVNFVSGLYADFKGALVSAVADLIPGDIPSEALLSTLLDAALVSAGIPPSLPNFDALVNDGIDYLASQVAEQAGVSPELLKQLSDQGIPADELNAAAKDFIKEQVKEGIQKGLEAGQYALGESVDFVPDGVPVVPDPTGSWQAPTLTLRITRTQAHPESDGVCPSSLLVASQITAQATDELALWNARLDAAEGPQVQTGKTYPLFLDDYLAFPVLKSPGESIDLPVVLEPALKYGIGGGWTEYQTASGAWGVIYHSSDAVIDLSSGCSAPVNFQWKADGTFKP